jgi:hypothetical protein
VGRAAQPGKYGLHLRPCQNDRQADRPARTLDRGQFAHRLFQRLP